MNVLTAAQTIAARSIRWTITPAPANLTESRQILRVLQGFGEVVAYKWLKRETALFEADAGLVIFRDQQSATNCLDQTPAHFTLDRWIDQVPEEPDFELEEASAASEHAEAVTGAEELTRPSLLLWPSQRYAEYQRRKWREAAEAAQNRDERRREARKRLQQQYRRRERVCVPQEFYLRASRWEGNHREQLERSHLYNPFEVDRVHPVTEDLVKRVPLVGLANVDLKGYKIPAATLRKYEEEVRARPKLRDWVKEREKKEEDDALSSLEGM